MQRSRGDVWDQSRRLVIKLSAVKESMSETGCRLNNSRSNPEERSGDIAEKERELKTAARPCVINGHQRTVFGSIAKEEGADGDVAVLPSPHGA